MNARGLRPLVAATAAALIVLALRRARMHCARRRARRFAPAPAALSTP